MSHSVEIRLIADQEIKLLNRIINIHDLEAIWLNGNGEVSDFVLKPKEEGWVRQLHIEPRKEGED